MQNNQLYAFGDFRLDVQEQLLTCRGTPVPLAPKGFDLLVVLVENAGKLVDKETLLQRIWNAVVVEDGNLAKHVSLVRKALSDNTNGTRYIETVPKRGYRFVAPVNQISGFEETAPALNIREDIPQEELPLISGPAQDSSGGGTTSSMQSRIARRLLVPGLVVFSGIILFASWILWTVPSPKVLATTQLTHYGRAWWTQKVLTDGARLYFAERTGGREALAWVPIDGGEPIPISTPFASTTLLDISRDHSQLLLGSPETEEEVGLWTMPVAGGSPQRLGGLIASDASWLPDGSGILFARGPDLFLARVDGSEPRKVSTTNGRPGHFQWAPDGSVMRFTVEDFDTSTVSIWEANPDGRNAHSWTGIKSATKDGFLGGECCGVWTPDGKYFVFRATHGNTIGLWARREKPGLQALLHRNAILLHCFPSRFAFFEPLVSPDGKRIMFVGLQDSRELARYDAASGRFVPYLSGVPARRVDFSGDGQYVAYYSPDYRLWRSRSDGNERVQLTFAPLNVANPRWSPDGSRIAFRGDQFGGSSRIYITPRDGGTLEAVTPPRFVHATNPCWSADGESLFFGEISASRRDAAKLSIHKINLKTGEIVDLPGSDGLVPEDISPDRKLLAAITSDGTRLVMFDVAKGSVTNLARGKSLYAASWSRDGTFIYFQDLGGGVEQPIYRVRVRDGHAELVAGLAQFPRADAMAFSLAGVTLDGSPLASLILSRGEIYSLDVELP